jgi:hypothetical protein
VPARIRARPPVRLFKFLFFCGKLLAFHLGHSYAAIRAIYTVRVAWLALILAQSDITATKPSVIKMNKITWLLLALVHRRRLLYSRRVPRAVRASEPRGQARQAGQTLGAVALGAGAALARPRVDEGARRRRAGGDPEA